MLNERRLTKNYLFFSSPVPSVQRHVQPSASLPRHHQQANQANQAQPSASASVRPRYAQQPLGLVAAEANQAQPSASASIQPSASLPRHQQQANQAQPSASIQPSASLPRHQQANQAQPSASIQSSASLPRHQQVNQAQPSASASIQPSASLPRHQQANQAQPSASASMQPRYAQQPLGSVAARPSGSGLSGPGPSSGSGLSGPGPSGSGPSGSGLPGPGPSRSGFQPAPRANPVNLNEPQSSEAVPIDNGSDDDDDVEYLDDEPQLLRPPHTPADNYLISSSTGIGNDSINNPPTPMDVHGDGDLSVPSPSGPSGANQNPLQSSNRRHRRDLDVDDMIDSTVDSTGFSSVNLNQQRSSNNDSNEGMMKLNTMSNIFPFIIDNTRIIRFTHT